MYSRNVSGKPDWLSGVVTKRSGPVSYCVKLDDNNCVIRRQQHRIRRKTDSDDVSTPTDIEQCAVCDPSHLVELPTTLLPELPQIDMPSQAVIHEETTIVKSPVRIQLRDDILRATDVLFLLQII